MINSFNSEPRTLVQVGDLSFLGGPLAIAAREFGGHVLSWAETSLQTSHVHVRAFDESWSAVDADILISVSGKVLAFDLVSLAAGGFAIAWNDGQLIKLRVYDATSLCDELIVGRSNKQVQKLDLKTLPTGGVAVSWLDFMVIVQQDLRILLSASTPSAWHSTIAILSCGTVMRVIAYDQHAPHGAPPIYGLEGALLTPIGEKVGEFRLDVPTTIVDNGYSHPEHLAACALSTGGFVVAWTQLAHHLGNSIQAKFFSKDGIPVGETIVVATATPTASVNRPAVTGSADGGFFVGWSLSQASGRGFRVQSFSLASERLGKEIAITDDSTEGRHDTLHIAHLSSGDLAAFWSEDQAIKMKIVPYTTV